jgi:hypothetical protein
MVIQLLSSASLSNRLTLARWCAVLPGGLRFLSGIVNYMFSFEALHSAPNSANLVVCAAQPTLMLS